jgi:hypothetical protein
MPSSSLNNMTVPLASDQSASTQGLLMPKLRYRFRALFENLGVSTTTTELTKQVVSFARPNLSFEQITLPIYNSTLKLAGRHTWQPVQIVVRDDAGGNVSKLIGEQIQKQMDFLEMSSAASGIDYKFQTTLEVLDGGNGVNEPVVLESWQLYGCYIQVADYGPMAYGSNEAVEITMTIEYDNANQTGNQGKPGGVGSSLLTGIGRTIAGSVTGVGSGA